MNIYIAARYIAKQGISPDSIIYIYIYNIYKHNIYNTQTSNIKCVTYSNYILCIYKISKAYNTKKYMDSTPLNNIMVLAI